MNGPLLKNSHNTLYTDVATGVLKERCFSMRVKAGPNAGAQYSLDGGTLMVGTHTNNDIVLEDEAVSRYHLELQVRSNGLLLKDLNTTNGTYLGETQIGSIVVSQNSVNIRIGKSTIIEIYPVVNDSPLPDYPKSHFGKVIGNSPVMQRLFSLLSKISTTDATLLLEGETGTGKEVVSEAVHQNSNRSNGPFIVVDCGAIPPGLIGSELFGHVKGAFTGAYADSPGLIQSADKGTLFLDEIGELSLELQPQLLRVLEKREVRHLGGSQSHKVDIRVIAATHRNLRAMVKAGEFREDLYYRLAVVRTQIPALRERGQDLRLLVQHFAQESGEDFMISDSLFEELRKHPWNGNVRELRNVVARILSLGSQSENIDVKTILDPITLTDGALPATLPIEPPVAASNAAILDRPFKEAKSELVEGFEKEYLVKLLERHNGNISRAAQEAGIDRNYIHRLVKKYGITIFRK